MPPTARACGTGWLSGSAAFAEAEREGGHRRSRPGDDRLPRRPRKFFLTASTDEERARRRHAEFLARGESIALEHRPARYPRARRPGRPAGPIAPIEARRRRPSRSTRRPPARPGRSRRRLEDPRSRRRTGRKASSDGAKPARRVRPGTTPIQSASRAPATDPRQAGLVSARPVVDDHDLLCMSLLRHPGDRPRTCPTAGRGAPGLQPPVSYSRRLHARHPARPPLELRRAFDPLLSPARRVDPFGRRLPDPARRPGASGYEGDARRLRAGGIVALFPEGTRSHDGELAELKAGDRRSWPPEPDAPILPAAVAGSFESWPRTRKLSRVPTRSTSTTDARSPPAEVAETLSAEAFTALIRRRASSNACRSPAPRLARDLDGARS